MKSTLISAIVIFVLALAGSLNAFGQNDGGRIGGRVSDANGAVVPGASVTITNVGTNEKRTATANDEGDFSVPSLRAAVYTVEASGSGFGTTTVTGVQLAVGQLLNLDVTLTPQAQTVTVDVVGGSETGINTSNASIGATVNQREVRDLPLNGRQLSQLYLQAPGTVNSGTGTFGDIRFSGRANQQNVVRYDGVEGSAIIDSSPGNLNGEVASPFRLQSSLENVQEFKADSNNYPAEYGTGTGGQVSVVTKSGSNDFHGSLFEYFRNEALDARNFFDNITPGIPKSILRLNQFGGSLGGRIIKDKLFFFGSYEGYRVTAGVNTVELAPYLSLGNPGAVLPTAANPQGNPNGTCVLGNEPTCVAANVRRYIPGFRSAEAISAGYSGVPGLEILQLQGAEKTNEDSFFIRSDWKANDKNSVYFRYFQDKGTDTTPEGVSGRNVLVQAEPRNFVGAWSSIFGNFINEFRVGYNAAKTSINGQAPTVNGVDFSGITLNVSGTTALLPSNTIAGQGQSAGISVPGGLVRANSATNGRGQPYNPYTLSFIDNFTWTAGEHTAKFGGEVRLVRMKTDRLGGTTYTFPNFNSFLSGTLQSVQYVGDLSDVSPFTGVSGERNAQQEYYIGFVQDEWRVRPGLTLNLGLRYEYYAPLREASNGQVLFDIVDGTLRDPSEAAYQSSKTNFGPRLSFAWSPNVSKSGMFGGGRTVIRGGFGIFYGPGQTEDQIQPIESDRISSTVSGGSFSGNTAADIATIVNGFVSNPNNRSYQPRAYSREYQIPERILSYTASYQQEWGYNLVSTIGYVGSKGQNLFLRSVANQILPGSTSILNGSNIPTGVGVVNRTNAGGQVIGVNTIRQFSLVSGTSVQNPYAEVDYKTSGGSDTYNALQMSLSRAFSTGLTMNAQYTWASSRGTSAGSNEARTSAQLDNFEADFGRNNFDVRHTFNISALYEMPVGKGKKFDLGNGAANYILGEWQIGGILNARSGLPIEVLVVRPDVVIQCQNAAGCLVNTSATATTMVPNGFVANLPTVGNGAAITGGFNAPALPAGFVAVVNTPGGGASRNIRRPNMTGEPLYIDNDRNILNPAAFSTPGPGTFGDLSRNSLRGPIFRQFDLTLAKNFKITETAGIQFRTEIFNLFNTTNFANPSATLNNSLPSLTAVNPNATNGLTTPIFTVNPSASSVLQPGTPFDQTRAGGAFGQIRSTVGRTVGLGTNRQIQFGLRLIF